MYGGIFYSIENVLLSVPVKEFWKSDNIWWSYRIWRLTFYVLCGLHTSVPKASSLFLSLHI